MQKHLPVKSILASNYLCKAEPFVSSLISPEKFKDILSVAKNFPGNLTSFLGFEIHLGDARQRADWAFAVSGAGDDRIVFENLLKQGNFPTAIDTTTRMAADRCFFRSMDKERLNSEKKGEMFLVGI